MIDGGSINKKEAVGSKKSKCEKIVVANGNGKNIVFNSNFCDGTAEEEKKMPPVSKVLDTNEVTENEGYG